MPKYSKVAGSTCASGIKKYHFHDSVDKAKEACDNDPDCKFVLDKNCKNEQYKVQTCYQTAKISNSDTDCIYRKIKGKFINNML